MYALLAERADARDNAEVPLLAHADQDQRAGLCRHRADLDEWLAAPTGREATGEQALLRELGGVA